MMALFRTTQIAVLLPLALVTNYPKNFLFDLGFVWPHLLIINRILYLKIFYLFSGFTMILLIQCFKAFNNTLDWKDPDSRKRGPKYGGEGITLTLCGFTDKSQ